MAEIIAQVLFDAFAEGNQLNAESWLRMLCAALSCRDGKDLTYDEVRPRAQEVHDNEFPITRERFVPGIEALCSHYHVTPEHVQQLVTALAKRSASAIYKAPARAPAEVPAKASAEAPAVLRGIEWYTDQLHRIASAESSESTRDKLVYFKRELKRLLSKMTNQSCDKSALLCELKGRSRSKCEQNWKQLVEGYIERLQRMEIDLLTDVSVRQPLNDLAEEISKLLDQQIAPLTFSFASPSCNPRESSGSAAGGGGGGGGSSRSRSRSPIDRRRLTTGTSTDGTPDLDDALGSSFNTKTLPNDSTRRGGSLRVDF